MNTWIEFTTEMNVIRVCLSKSIGNLLFFDAPLAPCDHATIKEHCYLAGIIPYSISFANFSEQDKWAKHPNMFCHVAFCNGSADGTKFFEKGKSLEHILKKMLLKLLEVLFYLLFKRAFLWTPFLEPFSNCAGTENGNFGSV